MNTSRQKNVASKEIFLDMKGACFLCLKGPSNDADIPSSGRSRVSLKKICRFLEVSELEVDGFSNNLDEGDSSSQREQLGFAVSLCEVCSREVNQLVGFIHELEEVQKRVSCQLQQVQVILEGSLENDQPNQAWKKNLLTASLVGFLRNEAGQKCLEKISSLGVITGAVSDVPVSTREPPTSSNQLNEVSSITSSEIIRQDFPKSARMESTADLTSIPSAIATTGADVQELPVPLSETSRHLSDASSTTSAQINHHDVPKNAPMEMEPAADPNLIPPAIISTVTDVPELPVSLQESSNQLIDASPINSAEINHLDFSSSAPAMEPAANPNSIPFAKCRPSKKRRNILIISTEADVPVSLQESSTSNQLDDAYSINASMESDAVSRSSSNSDGSPGDPSSEDQQTTWACQLADGGCGKIFSRKAKLTNHQLNYCFLIKLNPKEKQPEVEEMDEDSDDSEFWSTDPQPWNDGANQLSPDIEDCSREAVMKIFAKNFKISGRQFQCLHCKRASGRTTDIRRVRCHLTIYHPETVFPSSKRPRLSTNNFLVCLKELLRRETVAGKEEAKKRGEIARDERRESPLYCVECEVTIGAGMYYRLHRITEHYGSLKGKLASLQEDFCRGNFSMSKVKQRSVEKRRVEIEGGGGKKHIAAKGKTFHCAVEEGGCGKIFSFECNLKAHQKRFHGKVGRGAGVKSGALGGGLAGGDVEEEIGGIIQSSMECNQMEESRTGDEDDDKFECEYWMVKSE